MSPAGSNQRRMAAQPADRGGEWGRGLLAVVSGGLLFETVTGLSIWLLPFSVPNQMAVLLHTAAGLAITVPILVYTARHWKRYREAHLSHVKLTGYLAAAAILVAVGSGLVLTFQALFGRRIGYGWDLVHVVATFAVVAAFLPHVATLVVRALRARGAPAMAPVLAGQRRFALGTLVVGGALAALLFAGSVAYQPVELDGEFPEDYRFVYGPDRPFAPSLATTASGGAVDARALAGSEGCGTSGCHERITAEWRVSAHRWAAMDPGFQKVQTVMAEQNGPESTRYCGGCHDPISLFSGAKRVFTEELTNQAGYQEGVSCIVCHAIVETDVKGNAAFVVRPPERYVFEIEGGSLGKRISDFLIRAYPRHHVASLQHTRFKSPEFCAACHKQFIDEEINQVGWVQLQNQYDNWRKSRWNHPGEPERTVECRECHMPLQASEDPAAGDALDYNRSVDDGKHRSHRFLAANQVVPLLLDLEGAEEHVELTERWLRGEIEIPEIAHKWRAGPPVPVELVVPREANPGEEVRLQVVVTNNKVGHDFPTGPLDIIQAWLEIEVTDPDGNVVFASGRRDARHFIEEGSFIFKAEPVDQYGNLIDRHNLWEMVGVRYRRAVFPGFSDRAEYRFVSPAGEPASTADPAAAAASPGPLAVRVPDDGAGELRVTAKLLYRKFDQFLLDFLFGEGSGLTAPVTVMSQDEATIAIRPAATEVR